MMNLKKLAALVMSASLCFSLGAVSAFAEAAEEETAEAAVNEINWTDEMAAQIEEAGIAGDFVTFDEIAIKMFMPEALVAEELTDEDKEAGYIGYFSTEDQTAHVSVMYLNADMDLAEYEKYLNSSEDVANVETGLINGLEVVTYDMPDSDSTFVTFGTEQGYLLEIGFNPMSDEGFASTAALITCSIQPETEE